MLSIVQGDQPDITPAQLKATVIAGVPIILNLLAVFGVLHVTPEQEAALKDTAAYAAGFGGILMLADAHLRTGRNRAAAVVKAAGVTAAAAQISAGPVTTAPEEPAAPDVEDALPEDDIDGALPSDEDEFAAPPPREAPVQPSQLDT